MFGCVCSFTGNVVKEDCESTYAEVVHLFELGDHVVTVGSIPFDILSRMDCPDEVYLVAGSFGCQFFNLLCLVGRIGFTPAGTVERIVFRTIDVSIHLKLAVETKLADTVVMAPGSTVEAFDSSPMEYVRIVGNRT